MLVTNVGDRVCWWRMLMAMMVVLVTNIHHVFTWALSTNILNMRPTSKIVTNFKSPTLLSSVIFVVAIWLFKSHGTVGLNRMAMTLLISLWEQLLVVLVFWWYILWENDILVWARGIQYGCGSEAGITKGRYLNPRIRIISRLTTHEPVKAAIKVFSGW